jgi:hypothetical protein
MADETPVALERVDFLEMTTFQLKLSAVANQIQNHQRDIQTLQRDLKDLQKEQEVYVKETLKPKYSLNEGDGIDMSTGKITRKGDPGLTIARPNGAAPSVTPAVMG